jgi:hypothetical protein
MEKSQDDQTRKGKYETTVIFFFSKIPRKTQTPQEKMLCPELGVVSIQLFTNFQYICCPNAAQYRKRDSSDVCCSFGLAKRESCPGFDLHCVILICTLGYFVADATCILCVFQGTDLRSHINLS